MRAASLAPALAFILIAAPPLSVQAAPAYPELISPDDPAESLSRYLRMLAANPQDLNSLLGAGRAALLVGDPQAALGFYGRADEISPRNGRIKAGMAAALVQMEQTRAALKLFDEAVAQGVPEADVAGDRGLAYDLRGDNKRAQADYALALRGRPDPEITRRLALSLAISGDRPTALATLDPLLRGGDRAAWRARTFILAMSGDRAGAQSLADRMLPAQQAAAMGPFLGRLATLKPQQKALAVHFGRLPSDGRRSEGAELYADATPATPQPTASVPSTPAQPARSADAPLIPRGRPLGSSAPQVALAAPLADPPDPSGNAPRRRPGGVESAPRAGATAIVPPQLPAPDLALGGPAVRDKPTPATAKSAPIATPPTRMASLVDPSSELATADPAVAAAKAKAEAEARIKAKAEAEARAKAAAAARARADALKAKADAAAKAKADAKAEAKAKAEEKAKADAAAKAEAKAKAAQPERYWVQVASGKNKADLPKVWAKLKADKPSFFNGRSPWVSSWRASNRLLVGPFKDDDEAQGFVNRLAKAGMMTMQFTSRAGIPVERLAAK